MQLSIYVSLRFTPIGLSALRASATTFTLQSFTNESRLFCGLIFEPMVGSNGLEPSTSRLSGVCSNQLSYEPVILTPKGFGGGKRVRTADPLLAGQVLYQLSYTPKRSRK